MIFLTERFFIYLNILFKNYNKKNTLYYNEGNNNYEIIELYLYYNFISD